MVYSYYPGCSLHSTACEYDNSFRNICLSLGVEIREIPKWNCCGSTAAHSTSHILSLVLPLLVQSKAGEDEGILVPCASCFQRLKTAQYEIENSESFYKEISEILETDIKKGIRIIHPLEILSKDLLYRIRERIKRELKGLRIACYYGCLLTRPPKIMKFDEAEYPMSMDRIISTLGASTVEWNHKTLCCGASLSLTKPEYVARFIKEIISNAIDCGANAISVACPLCHSNLDMRQSLVKDLYDVEFDIPIFYFTELIELAICQEIDDTYLGKHFVSPFKLLEENKLYPST